MQAGNSGIGISGVEQRVMAMLAELESGLRRAEAEERVVGASLGGVAGPPRKRQAEAGGGVSRASRALETCDGAMAVIVFLWVASVIWFLLMFRGIGTAPNGISEDDRGSVQGATRGAALERPRQLSPGSSNATAPAAATDSDGLSAEAFEREVRRVFSQNGKRARGAGAETRALDYPSEPDYAFPLAEGESLPEPLAPPIVAGAQPAELPPVEAVAQAVETQKPRILKVVKSKAAAEKAGKSKLAKKSPPPSAQTHQEARAPGSLLAVATSTISDLIGNWSR